VIAMSVLTFDQAAQLAYNSGFRGNSLVAILAIAAAESGLDTNAKNLSDPFGGSFGILQLNGSHFHTGATNKACALDAQCSFNYAYGLSGNGTNFQPWGAYTGPSGSGSSGPWRQFISAAKAALKNINTKSASNTGNDPCWNGIKDGTPWQNVPACQPLNLQCFDPAQCVSYLTGGLKVSAVGPAMGNTGPLAAGTDIGTQVRNAILGPIEQFLPGMLEKVGLFLFALILIIAGFAILNS